MTICIAARVKTSEGYVTLCGSDREVTVSNRRVMNIEDSSNKMIVFPGAIVQIAGTGAIYEAIEMLKEDENFLKDVKFNTKQDIRRFALNAHTQYKGLVEVSLLTEEEAKEVDPILVTTPTKVWSIHKDLTIIEHHLCYAIGCGADTALAIMNALQDFAFPNTEDGLRKLLEKVIGHVCKQDLHCGGAPVILKPLTKPPEVSKIKPKEKANDNKRKRVK